MTLLCKTRLEGTETRPVRPRSGISSDGNGGRILYRDAAARRFSPDGKTIAFYNALIESFWGRMQVELLNRRRWKTRIELATAIHDYIEHFHNTRRRHSALGMLTPTEYEHRHSHTINAA